MTYFSDALDDAGKFTTQSDLQIALMATRVKTLIEQGQRHESYGTEGVNFLSSMGDLVTRLFFDLTSAITTLGKNIHRTELTAYYQSHKVSCDALIKAQLAIPRFNTIPLAYPHGMSSTYIEACDSLQKALAVISIDKTIDSLSLLTSPLAHIRAAGKSEEPQLALLKKVHQYRLEMAKFGTRKDFEDLLKKVFTKSDLGSRSGKSLYPENGSLGRVLTIARGYATEYELAFKHRERIKQTEKNLDAFIDTMSGTSFVVKELVSGLYALLKDASWRISAYGVVLHEMQRIEHNVALDFKKLVNVVKL